MSLSGTITGSGLPAGGTTFSAPIRSLTASWGCTILTLNLGVVRVDAAVTQLVDNGGPLQSIAALLNVLLTGLGL